MSELIGTFNCPICLKDTPHNHDGLMEVLWDDRAVRVIKDTGMYHV